MSDVTVSGGTGQPPISIPFDSGSNAALAQSLLSSAVGGNITIIPPGTTPSGPVIVPTDSGTVVDVSSSPVTVTGSGGSGQTIIAGSGGLTYNTGGGSSTVVAGGGDNLLSTSLTGDVGSEFRDRQRKRHDQRSVW